MTAAWVIIGLLVLGLPLLAWWVGGRRVWSRLEARGAADPAAQILRRHGLSTDEAAAVVSAVTRGLALEDTRQRAAAVELAELTIGQLFPSWEDASRGRRAIRVLGALWAVTAVAALAFAFAFGRLGDVNWFLLPLILSSVVGPFWQAWRLRRAIAVNSGPTGTSAV